MPAETRAERRSRRSVKPSYAAMLRIRSSVYDARVHDTSINRKKRTRYARSCVEFITRASDCSSLGLDRLRPQAGIAFAFPLWLFSFPRFLRSKRKVDPCYLARTRFHFSAVFVHGLTINRTASRSGSKTSFQRAALRFGEHEIESKPSTRAPRHKKTRSRVDEEG